MEVAFSPSPPYSFLSHPLIEWCLLSFSSALLSHSFQSMAETRRHYCSAPAIKIGGPVVWAPAVWQPAVHGVYQGEPSTNVTSWCQEDNTGGRASLLVLLFSSLPPPSVCWSKSSPNPYPQSPASSLSTPRYSNHNQSHHYLAKAAIY